MEMQAPLNANQAIIQERVNAFRVSHAKYFRPEDMQNLTQELLKADLETMERVEKQRYKNPTVARLLAIFPFTGILGIDRFYAGGKRNIIMGILKLLTEGGVLILWLYDAVTQGTNVKIDNYCRAFGVERSLKDTLGGIKAYLGSDEGKQQMRNIADSTKKLRDSFSHDI